MRLALLLAVALSVATPHGPVRAQDGSSEAELARARAFFQAGMAYFEEGEYERAIPQFERSLEITPAPELLYNLYVSHERIGGFAQAAVYLRTYLSVADVDGEDRDRLRARLSALDRRARAEVADAYPQTGVEGAPEERTDRTPRAPEPAEPAEPHAEAPPSAEPGERSIIGPAIALSVAAAGLVTFAVAGGFALERDSDLADDCGADADRTCSEGRVAGLERATLTADIGLGVAVAGALVGGLWLLLGGRDDDDSEPSTIAPAVGRRTAGMVWHGSF